LNLRQAIRLLCSIPLLFVQAEPGPPSERNSVRGWELTPDPTLPNVLLLGDSISIGYTLRVRELLAGKANVYRPMQPDGIRPLNCEGTRLGVRRLDDWLGDREWTVIHFNWGLHDLRQLGRVDDRPDGEPILQSDLQTYRRNLRQLTQTLQKTGARLIFATTTPVPGGNLQPPRNPEDPPRYNAAALEIMREHNVVVNDLYSLVLPRIEALQQPRNVHFTEAGHEVLARAVADSILSALRSVESIQY